jgi:hypothetical protein
VRVCQGERERERAAEGGCNFHSSCSGGFQARAISDIGDEDLHANEFARTNYTSLRIGMAHCSLGPNVEPMNCMRGYIGFQFKYFCRLQQNSNKEWTTNFSQIYLNNGIDRRYC